MSGAGEVFWATVAQIIPVLALALVVEVRFRRPSVSGTGGFWGVAYGVFVLVGWAAIAVLMAITEWVAVGALDGEVPSEEWRQLAKGAILLGVVVAIGYPALDFIVAGAAHGLIAVTSLSWRGSLPILRIRIQIVGLRVYVLVLRGLLALKVARRRVWFVACAARLSAASSTIGRITTLGSTATTEEREFAERLIGWRAAVSSALVKFRVRDLERREDLALAREEFLELGPEFRLAKRERRRQRAVIVARRIERFDAAIFGEESKVRDRDREGLGRSGQRGYLNRGSRTQQPRFKPAAESNRSRG